MTASSFDGTPHGARFYRVDLHIHSHGGSADVADTALTPEAIVATALERNIAMVAIADHNSVENVAELLAAADATGGAVAAIPGVELTTTSGHVLLYAAPDEFASLEAWLARQSFLESNPGERYVRKRIDEVAKEVAEAFGGIAIPAHVGRKNTGFLDHVKDHWERKAIFESETVLAMEVDLDHVSYFTAGDESDGHQDRAELMGARRSALAGSPRADCLATVVFSDAHSLERIGRSATGHDRVTRIKMDTPSFEGLRAALLDPKARIVLEERIPERYPHIVGVSLEGGFLAGRKLGVSPNLTAFIGGRGAGKSMALEAIRYVCNGEPPSSERLNSPAWPQRIQVHVVDEYGQPHILERADGEASFEVRDGDRVPASFEIEGYSQDKIAEISRRTGTEPQLLTGFLDQFVEMSLSPHEVEELHDQLLLNARAIEPFLDAPQRLGTAKNALAATQAKIKDAEKSNVRQILDMRRRLSAERSLRAEITKAVETIAEEIRELDVSLDFDAIAEDAGVPDIDAIRGRLTSTPPDPTTDIAMEATLIAASSKLTTWKESGLTQTTRVATELAELVRRWEAQDAVTEAAVQKRLAELREQNVEVDLRALNLLAATETRQKQEVARIQQQANERTKLLAERDQLVASYRRWQERRFHERQNLGRRLTRLFKEAQVGFPVSVSYQTGFIVDDYREWLRSRIGGAFFNNERLDQLCRRLHPIDLAGAVTKRDVSSLTALADDAGAPFFNPQRADEFLRLVGADPAKVLELQTIAPDDCAVIQLIAPLPGGKVRQVPFTNLSFGQRASILLGILLFSPDTRPLVIDQPEDHLDSAFIYEAVVRTLREVKERRQVIVATHNANIAVLGDAELIVPLQAVEGVGVVRSPGSVDSEETRARACRILEGGELAYRRRGEMYGLA